MSRRSKKRAKQAIPEEILAEGSGPNEAVEADVQTLAEAAADALAPVEVAGPEAEVEAAAMAAEVVVVAAEAARAEARESKKDRKAKKKGRKSETAAPAEPEVALDAWGQPIIIDEPDAADVVADADEAPADMAAEESAETAADESAEMSSEESAEMAADESAEMAAEESAEMAAETAADESADAAADEASAEMAGDDASAEMAADEDGEPVEQAGEGDADGVMPTSAATMDAAELKHLVEALVFAADKPVTIQRLRQLTRVSDVRRLEAALAELADDYKARGIALQVVSGGYQFRTNTTYSGWVQQLIAGRPVRLSRAQLETLAIVAYRQPITRPEIDEIRGVDSSSTLKVLLDRSLIRILGKREEAGRPTLYGTTKEFLDFFSLGDLRELPTLREYSELTAESRKVVSDRLGVSLDGTPAESADAPLDAGEDEPSTEVAEPTMDDALRAYVGDTDVSGSTEPAADSPYLADTGELSVDSHAAELSDSDVEASAELSADSHAGGLSESHAGEHHDEPSAELSADSHVDGGVDEPPAELSADSYAEASSRAGVDEPSAELSADSHLEESTELSGNAHEDEPSAELSADSHVEGSTELSTDSRVDEPPAELSADSDVEGATELSTDSRVDEPSAELSADSHVEESTERSANAHEDEPSADLSVDVPLDDSSELSADARVEDRIDEVSAQLSPDSLVEASSLSEVDERSAELSADPQDRPDAPAHGFLDPEELAGRVVSGESDVHAAGAEPDGGHARETDSAEDADGQHAADPEEQSASESDGADASAHDDPAVD